MPPLRSRMICRPDSRASQTEAHSLRAIGSEVGSDFMRSMTCLLLASRYTSSVTLRSKSLATFRFDRPGEQVKLVRAIAFELPSFKLPISHRDGFAKSAKLGITR